MDRYFSKWVQETKEYYEDRGISVDYIKINDEGDESSAVVDYITSNSLARITVLRRGFADLEILDIDTEQNVYYKHFEINKEVNWVDLLSEFFSILSERI